MMKKSEVILAVAVMVACGASVHATAAEQGRKKPRTPPAASNAAPTTRADDLNSPSTDFSGVKPVIDDPKAELMKPRKKKDPFFD